MAFSLPLFCIVVETGLVIANSVLLVLPLFFQVVAVTLDNYEIPPPSIETEDASEPQQNWVREMLIAEGRAAVAVMRDAMSKLSIQRESPHFKDPAKLSK